MNDHGLSALLDMNDVIVVLENGYWYKIEVQPTDDRPHGIRYSLTLHEPSGERVLGYDNAHPIRPPKGYKYSGQRLPFDHRHRHIADKGVPYHFKDAHQLLLDFFAEIDKVLKEVTK